MAHPRIQTEAADQRQPIAVVETPTGNPVIDSSIPERYELLLSKLSRAERELENSDVAGRSGHLEDASGIVFDLLYSLDYKRGGELVPRLAALYGYIGNELLNVGRTGDRVQLAHLRDMITTLRQSWYGGVAAD
jgi:flagellar biosynthetic protein FliS